VSGRRPTIPHVPRVRLELSALFLELAAREDPPATVVGGLRVRLEDAGVENLDVAVGDPDEGIDLAQEGVGLEKVTAIFFGGPGLSFAELLEEEPTPVAAALLRIADFAETFNELRRFRLAALDMRSVETTALALLEHDGPARFFERMLNTAVVVTYARPYLSGPMRLADLWHPKDDDLPLHKFVIHTLRHPYHAHPDRTRHRTLIDTTAFLGIKGPPTFREGWHSLRDDELEAIADLAQRQAARLEAEADRLGAALGEKARE